MKKETFFALLLFIAPVFLFSQDEAIDFSVKVSTDSILFGNYFEVKFTLENAQAQNFEAPDFSESFTVVSGPNTSSSISMINGETTQSISYTYYLEPKDIGTFYILPASVEAAGELVETQPFEVLVVPNPDGIKQTLPSQQRMDRFHFDLGNPFDNLGFGFPEINTPPSEMPREKPVMPSPPKKKLKTIRI